MDINDPRYRLTVLNQSNPSIRIATAPKPAQQTINVGGSAPRTPNISIPGAPANNSQSTPVTSWSTPSTPKSGGFGGFLKSAARTIAHPFAEFGTGLAYTPKAIYREIQNKPIDDIQKRVFGTNDSGQIAKKILSDTAQIGLTVAAPGAGAGASTTARVGIDAGLGAGFGGAQALGDNQNLPTIAKSAAFGGVLGGLFAPVAKVAGKVIAPITKRVGGDLASKIANETSASKIASKFGIPQDASKFLANESNPETVRAVLDQMTSSGIPIKDWVQSPALSSGKQADNTTAGDISATPFDATNPPQSFLPAGMHAPNAADPVEVLSKQASTANSASEFADYYKGLSGEEKAVADSALNGKTPEEFFNAVKGHADTVLHLPDAGVHAKLTPEQADILANEGKNIPFTAKDRPHLTAGPEVLKRTREVTQEEIAAMSPNAKAALDNAKKQIDEAGAKAVPSGDQASALPPEDIAAIKAAGGTVPESVAPSGTSAEAVKGDISTTPASPSEVSPNSSGVAKPQDSFVGTGKQADNATYTKVAENPEISQQTKDFITNKTHEVRSPEQLSQIAGELSAKDPNAALALLRDDSFALKQPDAYTAVASNLINKLSTDGNSELGGAVYDQIIDHASRLGQGLNSIKLLYQITPQGQATFFERLLAKSGISLTSEESAGLRQALSEANAIEDPLQRGIAQHDIAQQVSSMIPTSKGDKAVSFWKAMLLSSPTTTAGNILSNTVEAVTMKGVVHPLATAIDKAISLVTGERTTTNAGLKFDAQGIKKGFSLGKTFLKTGFDQRRGDPLSKYGVKEVNFGDKPGGQLMSATVNGIFKFMGAQDQPFFYRELQSSLASQAKAHAINGGLKGAERKAFIEDFVKNPPTEAGNIATNDAYRAVFGNSTKLGKAATDLQGLPGGNLIIPFTNVPASIATRVLERTPVGAVNEIVKQISAGKLDQRALSLALSNSTAGTAGALLVGKALVDHNMITLGFPTDKKEQQLWKLEGRQPYSIKVGNKWLSLNYVQPFGSVLSAGAAYSQARKDGQSIEQAIGTSGAEAAKAVSSQSFLQGISRTLSAVQEPGTYGSKFLESTAGSLVPNILRHVATATDPNQRQTNSPMDNIKSGIPGVRKSLPAQQDVFGADVPKNSGGLNPVINPLKPSDIRTSDTTTELRRLQDAGFGAVPPAVDKNFISKDHQLTPAEVSTINSQVGPQVQAAYQRVMSDPNYNSLSDEQKANALQNAASDVRAVFKTGYSLDKGYIAPDSKQAQLSDNQKTLMGGNLPDYISKQLSGSSSSTAKINNIKSPDAQAFYKQYDSMNKDAQTKFLTATPTKEAVNITKLVNAQRSDGLSEFKPSNAVAKAYAEYEADLNAHPDYSAVVKRNKAEEFQKFAYKLNYSQPQRDIYSEGSSTDLKTLIDNKEISKEDLDNAIKMDDELYNSGLTGSLKFSKKFRAQYGYGLPSGGNGSNKGGSGTSSGSSKSVDAHLTSFIPGFKQGASAGNKPEFSRKSRTTPSFQNVNLPKASPSPKVTIKL
jgi:hypothetical protein